MFALVDANSFYCSAEQVFRPDWRGKPMLYASTPILLPLKHVNKNHCVE